VADLKRSAKKMSAKEKSGGEEWLEKWLDAVVDGSSTMSQRKLSAIETKIGLVAARKAAQARGVHLLRLTDERGEELIAASKRPFKIVC
jgi:hypothetical protein